MNIAYFRKSTFSVEKTLENVTKKAKEDDWKILGETPLPDEMGKMVLICKSDWVKTLIQKDHNLLGFLPCAISVFKKDGEVLIGTGQPAVIKAISQNEEVTKMATVAESMVKKLINESAGVGELKPSKVKLYSTTTCPYCKMEAAWLDEKKVKYEEVHVDLNQKEAEEMVRKTGQMGVPVTVIQYDGGEEENIIGFNKPQLAQILEIKE
jgi:glutaredoxin 3